MTIFSTNPTVSFAPVAPSAYLGTMARRMLVRRWWLFAVPLAVTAIGCFTDWRIAVIGLMLVFIVYPMIMSLVMLNYALHPSVIARARTASATFAGNTLLPATTHPIYIAEPAAMLRPATLKIDGLPIRRVSVNRTQLLVETGDGIADFVIIPAKVINPALMRVILTTYASDY